MPSVKLVASGHAVLKVVFQCHRYDVKLEMVLRARRRAGRMMPLINVIPPGLDFSSLKVDLPKDPAQGNKPPPKHASFSHHSNPTSPRSSDGSSPHAEAARLSEVSSPGTLPLPSPSLWPAGMFQAYKPLLNLHCAMPRLLRKVSVLPPPYQQG